MLIQNAEFRYNSSNNDKTLKKLNGLNKQLNGIKITKKKNN